MWGKRNRGETESVAHIKGELERMAASFNQLLAEFSEQAVDLEIERENVRQLTLALASAEAWIADLQISLELRQAATPALRSIGEPANDAAQGPAGAEA